MVVGKQKNVWMHIGANNFNTILDTQLLTPFSSIFFLHERCCQ